jgi:hypothetical protein
MTHILKQKNYHQTIKHILIIKKTKLSTFQNCYTIIKNYNQNHQLEKLPFKEDNSNQTLQSLNLKGEMQSYWIKMLFI